MTSKSLGAGLNIKFNRLIFLTFVVIVLTAYDYKKTHDKQNGLQWSVVISDEMPWIEAKKYCNKVDENGFTDWVLPTKKQLESTIDPELKQEDARSKERPYYDFFYTEEEGFVFSITEVDGYDDAPYVMRLVNAHIFNGKGREARVRCVRTISN